MKTLNEIAKECLEISRKNGFSVKRILTNIKNNKWYLASKTALIHTEVAEMTEAIRTNDWAGLIEEGIDVIIRTLEFLIALYGTDIDQELKNKIEKNKNRPFKHGGKLM